MIRSIPFLVQYLEFLYNYSMPNNTLTRNITTVIVSFVVIINKTSCKHYACRTFCDNKID